MCYPLIAHSNTNKNPLNIFNQILVFLRLSFPCIKYYVTPVFGLTQQQCGKKHVDYNDFYTLHGTEV